MVAHRLVEHLPDLISPEEYDTDPSGYRVRLRLQIVDGEVVILGDATRAAALETVLSSLGDVVIDQMLCG